MLAFVFATAVAVVSPTPSPTPSPPPEIAHVVTSDRGDEAASRATRTTYVVTAADIARNGYRTVADALTQVPGVYVARYGPFGQLAQVNIRGSSALQTLVLLDGLPVAGSQIENVNLEQMAVAGVDRIEVVEGGGSTLYGSGSIGGVINIITTGATPARATVSTGSFGQQTYQVQTPYFAFQRTYAANDYGLPGGGSRVNADAGLTAGTLTYSHPIGGMDLQFLADFSDSRLGDPGPMGFTSSTERQDTIARDVRLKLSHRSPHAELTLAMGGSAQDFSVTCDSPNDYTCPNWIELPAGPKSTPPPYAEFLNDQRGMVEVTNAAGGDRQRLVYGIDVSGGNDRIDGGTGSACPPSKSYYGYGSCGIQAYQSSITPNAYSQSAAFVQAQWFGGNGATYSAGLRGERDLNSLATAQGGALSPSIGAILPLASGLQLKLNAATAFRAPTAEELFYPPQGIYSNSGLVPERTRVGDATLVQRGAFGDVSFGWFTTSGSNLIVDENPVEAEFKPVNIGRASIQGFTLSLHTRPYRHLVTTLDVTNLYRAQNLDTQSRIVGRGPVFATVLGFRYVTLPSSGFDGVGVTITNNGQFEPQVSYVPSNTESSAFTTVDAYAGFRIAPTMLLTVRGYNLLDARYAVYDGFPMPGPGVDVELRSR
ncbi:MAG TPA: TonB-dependent receptor [Candidatus Baltobacteraceae bacterium]|jgi:vitamin B12 transporter|nr:TonB-dependent receptor [Candidatus Baltobacteraceae bacterium]